MPRGFVQDPLEIKLLILYILARAEEPLDLPTLTDLTLCDEGVDYFQFIQALNDLCRTQHVVLEDQRYAITPKGRANGATCESAVAYSVRAKCDRNVDALNEVLRRNRQVQAAVSARPEGGHTVTLSLSDDTGSVLRLEMLAGSAEQAGRLADNFKAHAEQIYNGILSALLAEYDQKD